MRSTTLVLCMLGYARLTAQAPGDQVFNEDQVLTIDLQFAQAGFWDSLVANYETETYMMADLTVTDLTGTYSFDSIGVRLKGNSSYGHPGNKKSFKIDFNRYVAGQEYDGLRKLNFNNGFKDPTFMREKIYYDVCADNGINAPRANYANVYMNDELWGFYTVVEQVDDEFLDTRFGENNENLFKAGDAFGGGPGGGTPVSADLQYYGTDTTDYYDRYTLENNADENDWGDLIRLTDFINNTSDADFANQLSLHFNVPQLMKSIAMYNLFANLDSYLNSARNYYIYDLDSTGVWEWINWDCNEAFGLYTGGPGTGDLTALDPYYYTIGRPLVERIVSIPSTQSTYDYYYCELFTAYFQTDFIDSQIDELYTLIQPHVYADPNKMYTNSQFDQNIDEDVTTGGMGGTAYGLRSFISERAAFLDDAIDCSDVHNSIKTMTGGELMVYPNPARGYLVIQSDAASADLLQLLDMTGKICLELQQPAFPQTLEISSLPAGGYIVAVYNGAAIQTVQFIRSGD